MDLVSIIIPVYNVSAYLRRCLDSVVSQTYSNTEILVIDDGSTDESPEICDEYSEKYENLHVIHKSNGGVSSARNMGMKISRGDYIMFVDSDDAIEPNVVEVLHNCAIANNTLLSCCLIDVIDTNGKRCILEKGKTGLYTKNEIEQGFFCNQFIKNQLYGPFNKLIHRKLLEHISFKPYKMGEDILFVFEVIQNCKTVYISPLVGYHYIHRIGSAMKSAFNINRLDYIYAGEEILQISKIQCPNITPLIETWLFNHTIVTLRQIVMSGMKEECEEFYDKKKRYLIENKKYIKHLSLKQKINLGALLFFPSYFKVVNLFK